MGVYFVQQEDGPIKVGVANDVLARVRNIQTANPRELWILAWFPDATQADERRAHDALSPHRIRGEWFRPHVDVLRHIDALAVRFGLPRDRHWIIAGFEEFQETAA